MGARPRQGIRRSRAQAARPASPSARAIAVTAGEPAGIGPDLCVELARRRFAAPVVVVADESLLLARARRLGVRLRLARYVPGTSPKASPGTLLVHPVAMDRPAVPGRLDAGNARYVLKTLDAAIAGCRAGTYAAMVTGPLQKSVINEAGIPFTGHTEYLARRTATRRVVMMLVGGRLRVALATTHLPLREVAAHITRKGLTETLAIVCAELSRRFGIERPRVLIAGLNPHAGESGFLGREEIEVIAPAVQALRRAGQRVEGPLPADTLFQPHHLRRCDCVLAMYHDQGLPVLKYASFGRGVNVTLGLPIIRTSVDHGTALNLAGTGRADAGSLIEAIRLAIDLAEAERAQARRRGA